MIKSEIADDAKPKKQKKKQHAKKQQPVFEPMLPGPRQYIFGVTIALLCLLGVVAYLLARPSTVPERAAARNVGDVPALPLANSSSLNVSNARPNSSSDKQSSTNLSGLSAQSINLQNNVPAGQSTAQTNSLQSTGSALSTGQSINSNQPY